MSFPPWPIWSRGRGRLAVRLAALGLRVCRDLGNDRPRHFKRLLRRHQDVGASWPYLASAAASACAQLSPLRRQEQAESYVCWNLSALGSRHRARRWTIPPGRSCRRTGTNRAARRRLGRATGRPPRGCRRGCRAGIGDREEAAVAGAHADRVGAGRNIARPSFRSRSISRSFLLLVRRGSRRD